jgi:hypothetical protein
MLKKNKSETFLKKSKNRFFRKYRISSRGKGVLFILGPVYNNQAQTSYFEYIIPKKFISKVFRGNPTLHLTRLTNKIAEI